MQFPPEVRALFALAVADDSSLRLARVVRQDRGRVRIHDGEHVVSATWGMSIEPPIVGDFVAARDDRVHVLLERRQLLSRRAAGGVAAQHIAANVDQVVVVQPASPLNLPRIERGVAVAFDSGAGALVVLTKSDLASAVLEVETRLVGVEVIEVCAPTGAGLDVLRGKLVGRTNVMIGPSGAGKSTLLNAVLDEEVVATQEVRAGDGKGRHTTTRRELFELPTGGSLIDTPGTRELGLWLGGDDGPAGFDEIDALAATCAFRDCAHGEEPNCAVRRALDEGSLDAARFASFDKQRRELRWLEEKTHEQRGRMKRFAGEIKVRKRLKGR